ncbi:unnamed protein product, partial [Polarella glacialis]
MDTVDADPEKLMAPRGRASLTKPDLLNLWKKIDTKNNGFATLEEVLGKGKLLQEECQDFIDNWASVAKDGKVTRQAFLDFCMGTKAKSKGTAEKEVELEINLESLRSLFDRIVPVRDAKQELRLADLVAHKAELEAVFPGLVKRFSGGDLDGSQTLSWDELRILASGTDEWLEYKFDRIIGLQKLKDQLRQFHQSVMLDKKRAKAGHEVKTGGKFHMIFQGNPGTGKTTVARLVAELMQRIGIIETDLLVEVQRDKLVAEYVGQTGPKTQAVIEEAKSGILFIDEAYRLSGGGGKDFGREAIEQLMGAMNDSPGKAPVMVFAGYPDDMEAFMNANSGLYRRIAYTFEFTDYDPSDLAQILEFTAKSAGFYLQKSLSGPEGRERLAGLIAERTLPEARAMMNGGLCERLFTFAKQSLDDREMKKGKGGGPISMEILEEDLIGACTRIPPPPAREAKVTVGSDGGGGKGGPDPAATAVLTSQLSAAQRRVEKAEARCLELEVEAARARAEVQVMKEASHAAAGGADKMADYQREQVERVIEAQGRASAADAQLGSLRKELEQAKADAAQARGEAVAAAAGPPVAVVCAATVISSPAACDIVPPPAKYEVLPCLRHSCGCLGFFTVVFLAFLWKWTTVSFVFLWKWTRIIARWLWKQSCALASRARQRMQGKQ